jgi:alginate O-acetyltransferase complex protein AlgI
MGITDLIFLFLFLPCSLLACHAVRRGQRDYVLLAVSLVFYALGSLHYFLRFVLCIFATVAVGRLMYAVRGRKTLSIVLLALGCAFNLAVLARYKYGAFGAAGPLPLGISFFTFKAISYLADIHRGRIAPHGIPVSDALYLSFFPQVQSGPLSRYSDMLPLADGGVRCIGRGAYRFIGGFNKKILIANVLQNVTGEVFSCHPDFSSPAYLWLGAVCYSLQIYYDFSGYSDMAVGLSNMFGYGCPENFIYPYTTPSVSKFWRKWHATLGAWFRDYVYIPLGGSRCAAAWRVYANLLAVWILTGIWHGAALHFVCWGLGYFAFIAFEKATGLPDRLKSAPLKAAYRILTLAFINFQWVIFRADSLAGGLLYIQRMFVCGSNPLGNARAAFLLRDYLPFIAAALVFCVPVVPYLEKRLSKRPVLGRCLSAALYALSLLLFLWGISFVIAGQNNPFAYANF